MLRKLMSRHGFKRPTVQCEKKTRWQRQVDYDIDEKEMKMKIKSGPKKHYGRS